MNFKEALNYVENSSYGHSLNLDNLKEVLLLLNINERDFRIIQIAGTNGKGTVGTFLSYFINSNNKKVGHFSSPHLEDYRERFKINNRIIDDESFIENVEYLKEIIPKKLKDKLTYFEISFILGLVIFKKECIDYLIIETGIGGRFDITNIFDNNILSIITTIGYDHVNILGETLEDIAYHKAGIIKENSKVVSFKHTDKIDEILLKESETKNSKLCFLDIKEVEILNIDLTGTKFKYDGNIFQTPMIGEHQGYNISLSLLAYKNLNLCEDIEYLKDSIKKIKFEGRMEIILDEPLVIVDGAHNSEGLNVLYNNIINLNLEDYILIIGSMNDKDIFNDLNKLLVKAKFIIFTKIDYDRAIAPETLANILNMEGKDYKVISNLKELKEYIIRNFKEEVILITGSLYLVGEIKKIFKSY